LYLINELIGKTYTMFGQKCEGSLNPDAGLAPRVAFELFQLAEERKTSFDVQVTMNMFEVSFFMRIDG